VLTGQAGLTWAAGLLLVALATTPAGDARGEPGAPAQPKPAPAVPAAPTTPAAPQQSLPVSIEQALYLIRSTLLTLNDANRSGNYSVLRDLAAPDFQARNTAADLAISFTDLRRRNFDLFAVALAAPQLTATPALDANRMLRLTGLFPTRPLQIKFDLMFQAVNGQWRLDGIAIATPEAPVVQAADKPASPPASVARKPAPKAQ
jgi:hypothetical protein